MLGLLLRPLCQRRTAAHRATICTTVSIILVASVAAARPSLAGGLSLAISRPLAFFPGCRQDCKRSQGSRTDPPVGPGTRRHDRMSACGDASHQQLRGASLSGVDLNHVRLVGSVIHGSVFSKANLNGSCAALSRIKDSTFDGASLAGADLSSATLWRVSFNGADLVNSRFKGAYGRGTVARKASMRNAILVISQWDQCDFSGADLERADLSSAHFQEGKLSGANLRGAKMQNISAERGDFTRANLQGANIEEGKLRYANLSGSDLRGAVLVRADLTGANLTGAKLAGSDTRDADLNSATLCQGDLAHLREFRGTPLTVKCPGAGGPK